MRTVDWAARTSEGGDGMDGWFLQIPPGTLNPQTEIQHHFQSPPSQDGLQGRGNEAKSGLLTPTPKS